MSGWSSWHWCGGRICIMQLTPSFQPGGGQAGWAKFPTFTKKKISGASLREHLTEEKNMKC